jgi:PilZ domain
VAWTDANGTDRYARGKCRDISTGGLRIETTETIPAQAYVNIHVEKVDVSGSARVRYTRWGGKGSVSGLELGQNVRQQLLDALRETTSNS